MNRAMQRPVPFGEYILLERISVGGMAELFKAKRVDAPVGSTSLVAIKRIIPHLAEDERFIQMFINEAGVAAQLKHPNIAAVYELGQSNDSHYIAMDYVSGRDLLAINQYIRRGGATLPLELVRHIGSMTARGLAYAHAKRNSRGEKLSIVHRDISPENILVGFDGSVQLIDFGIAKAKGYTNLTQTGALKGKCGYMSPEQVAREPLDHRSDIFALGTVIYETLTGQTLFKGDNEFLTLERVRIADVPPASSINPQVPPELDEALAKSLARHPRDRFHDAAHMARALSPGGVNPQQALSSWIQEHFAAELLDERISNERWKNTVLDEEGEVVELEGEDSTAIHESASMPMPVFDPNESQTMAHPPSGPFEISLLGGRLDGTPPPSAFRDTLGPNGAAPETDRSGDVISLLDEIPELPPDRTRELPTVTDENLGLSSETSPPTADTTRTVATIVLTVLFATLLGISISTRLLPGSPASHSGLIIKVIPRVALELSLDGRTIAQTAPVVISPLKAGPHIIKVLHQDYQPFGQSIELEAGKFTTVDIFMEPLR
jgi:serine/threonine protein kinase